MITVPLAVNSATVPSSSPSAIFASTVTEAVCPLASAICEATVRFQMRSYSRSSGPRSDFSSSAGVRNVSPAGRMASCASCAFLLLEAYTRGFSGTVSAP